VLNKWAEKSAMQSSIETILDGACPRDRYEFGFADLTGLLAGEYRLFSFGVSILRPLDARIIDGIAGGPTPEYHRHYRAVNRELAEAVERVRDGLDGLGIRALGVKPTVEDGELDDGYYKTLRLNFSHKMAATRAGLGWIGKTDLFISKKHGPRVRLASVLLDAPVTSRAAPIDVSLCGTCEVCVTACPAGAATGALWDIRTDRDVFFDAFKCRERCRELSRERIREEISLCGICVSVCPVGNRNKKGVPKKG
jgi:epoxyqueuosine reductase QueG